MAQLRQGSAGAAAFLDRQNLSPASGLDLASASQQDCLQAISAPLAALLQQHQPGEAAGAAPAAGTALQGTHHEFAAVLLAYAAGTSLLHVLDAGVGDASNIDDANSLGAFLHQQEAAASSAQANALGLPDLASMYALSEGIRASKLPLQDSSICIAAREFSALRPQLENVTADAQPLAHSQLLNALRPLAHQLLAWHMKLRPMVQQQISRLQSIMVPPNASIPAVQLSTALIADQLCTYIAGLAEMLKAFSPLAVPQKADLERLVQLLPAQLEQIFRCLAALAERVLKQVQAGLSTTSSRQALEQILDIGLPVDQVRQLLLS